MFLLNVSLKEGLGYCMYQCSLTTESSHVLLVNYSDLNNKGNNVKRLAH